MAFDVDDTLYLERDYVRSGFRAVATTIGVSSEERQRHFERLWGGFLAGERGSTFNDLLDAEPGLAGAWTVGELVRVYREHVPDIELLLGIERLLDTLFRAGVRLGAITDGPAAAQRRKVEALGIRRWVAAVVLTDELSGTAGKPSHDGYLSVMEELAVGGHECVYVGDNPRKDFRGARELGWRTIRLRLPGQLHEAREAEAADDAADEEVRSVGALGSILRRWTEYAGA